MDKNGIKMNILCSIQFQWQNCKYLITPFHLNRQNTFSNGESVNCQSALDCGFDKRKLQGLLKKTAGERVSSIISRRSPIGRLPIHPTATPAGRPPERGPARWCAMSAAVRLTGDLPTRDFEHQTRNQEHRKVEELHANAPRGSFRPVSGQRARATVVSRLAVRRDPNVHRLERLGLGSAAAQQGKTAGLERDFIAHKTAKKIARVSGSWKITLVRLLPPSSTRLRRGRRRALRAGSHVAVREGAGPSCRPEREKERGHACCPAGPRLAGPRGGELGLGLEGFLSFFFSVLFYSFFFKPFSKRILRTIKYKLNTINTK